ncbi:hypothetical protein PanWU01x14_239820 [Parasponia andersonii]|uniref:Uncharacterized protein n=1 Tax=Parasponia andersonii TaxID=3476 RepID=A0A2P5BH19_PARAD|nr:hypothetical protein PanWU01x14_239820 [Parasponia andersonii]
MDSNLMESVLIVHGESNQKAFAKLQFQERWIESTKKGDLTEKDPDGESAQSHLSHGGEIGGVGILRITLVVSMSKVLFSRGKFH